MMFDFIKKKFEKKALKKTFQEYGFEVKSFDIEGYGKVEYAQWLHPFEMPRNFTASSVNFYKALARQGHFIIDIGTHTGDTTLPMALAVGKQGLVIGLEPNQYVYKILEKNASLNTELTNIVPLCFAATAEDGTFTFHYSDASFCNGGFLSQIKNQRHHHPYTLDVVGKRLEVYLFEHYADRLPQLDLLKVDAEGYDKEILKTLPNILQQFKPNLMVECYKRLNDAERTDLFDVIDGFGYDLFYLENFEENASKVKIGRGDMNKQKHFEMLAIHRERSW